jgi:hypothetical protein
MSVQRFARRITLAQRLQAPQPLYTLGRRFASQDYGSGKGDPKGEKPQEQGSNPSADKEHPGPPPPKAGQGSGSTPTKGTAEGHNTDNAAQGQKRSFSTYRTLQFRHSGPALMAEKKPKSAEGLSPKLYSDSPPSKDKESEEVKKHNEELEQRAERAHEGVSNEDTQKDKVGKDFWKGMFSVA